MQLFTEHFCFQVGLSGLIIFSFVFGIGSLSSFMAVNIWTKRIFILLSCSSVLDLPIYMHMLIFRDYAGKFEFCFHLLADIFYFGGFSMVIFSWGEVLRSCSFDDLFEKKQRIRLRYIIVTLNILCFGYTVANVFLCATSDELIHYFDSQDFVAYMLVTVVRNSIMGVSLFIYGSHLFSRLGNYSRSTHVSKTAASKTLLTACNKLILLVVVSNAAFALQLLAVILWLRFDSSNSYYLQSPDHVRLSPYVYWLLLECLPKVVPSVTFYLTMGFLNQVWDRNRTDSERDDMAASQNNSTAVSPTVYDSEDDKSVSVASMEEHRTSGANSLVSPLLRAGNAYYGNEEDEVFYNSMRSSLGDTLTPSDLLRNPT